MRLASSIAVCCAFLAPLQAQPTPKQNRLAMFERHLAGRAAGIGRHTLAGIADAAEWQRRRPEIRRQLLDMLGLDPLPVRTALHARTTGGFERSGYRVEKIVFESLPGLYVTGNLYLPTARAGRLPAVLYVCGHSPDVAGAKVVYQRNGIWLAGLGYVVFVIDPLHFGEIPGVHQGTHNLGLWYWQSLGYTPAGPEVWSAMRAIDYLETRPEVDTARVAMTGGSGGGAVTWYTAALDERVRAATPRCATWSVENQVAANAVVENCDCIYYPNTYQLDFPAVAALIAPRPLMPLNAMRDPMFPRAGYQNVFERSRAVYDLLGAGGRIGNVEDDVPHRDTPLFRQRNFGWIGQWLKDERTAFEERELVPEESATLRVLDRRPAGAINDAVSRTFIRTRELERPRDLQSWQRRRVELAAQLKDKVFRAFPRSVVPFETWKGPENGWTARFAESWNVEFTSEEGIRVGGQLFVPRTGRRPFPALIVVKGAADIVYPVDYDFILPALGNHVVLVLRPRAVDYPVDNLRMATLRRTAALVGATVESMQVWDILRAVDFLVQGERLPVDSISLYGRGEMGALAMYAGALDGRVARVIVDNPPASHWQGPALLNVLRVTDLAEAAALLAPRELVSLTPLPSSYDFTAGVFALYGPKAGIRQAGGLAAALQIQ